jgi:hypothetical protein
VELEYGELKVVFVNRDNTKIEHQANTINISDEKGIAKLFEYNDLLLNEVKRLKEENKKYKLDS